MDRRLVKFSRIRLGARPSSVRTLKQAPLDWEESGARAQNESRAVSGLRKLADGAMHNRTFFVPRVHLARPFAGDAAATAASQRALPRGVVILASVASPQVGKAVDTRRTSFQGLGWLGL